jgi:hypothetical protein
MTRPANRLLALAVGAMAIVLLLLFYLLMQHVVDAARQQRLAAGERSQALSQCWPLHGATDRALCRDRVLTAMDPGAVEAQHPTFADSDPQVVRVSAVGQIP